MIFSYSSKYELFVYKLKILNLQLLRTRDATGSPRFSTLPAHKDLDRQSCLNPGPVNMWSPQAIPFSLLLLYVISPKSKTLG